MSPERQPTNTSKSEVSSSNTRKSKTLVTGGGGFIGSHLASYLAARGDEVVVLDNFSTGRRENLDGVPVQIIEGDIRDLDCVIQAVEDVDTVFHQAALCSVARSVEDPLSTHAVNISGTLNIFEASCRAGVRRVVYASSSSVYGNSATLPKVETMRASPLSPYAISKLTGEFYGELYWRLFGLETVALRYFNVFGPRQDPTSEYSAVIPLFMKAILDRDPIRIFGDGHQTRDFTYVDNVVQANVDAAVSHSAPGQVFNIACGGRWSLLELVELLEEVSQRRAMVEFRDPRVGDVLHSQASIVRAQELLGYSPSMNFVRGIWETFDWFQKDGSGTPLSLQDKPPARHGAAGGYLR